VDGWVWGFRLGAFHPFHHGIKKEHDVERYNCTTTAEAGSGAAGAPAAAAAAAADADAAVAGEAVQAGGGVYCSMTPPPGIPALTLEEMARFMAQAANQLTVRAPPWPFALALVRLPPPPPLPFLARPAAALPVSTALLYCRY
jgi:hypothetical protein